LSVKAQKTLKKKEINITFLEAIYPETEETFLSFRKRVKVIMQDYMDKVANKKIIVVN